jgi:hypothetical protein
MADVLFFTVYGEVLVHEPSCSSSVWKILSGGFEKTKHPIKLASNDPLPENPLEFFRYFPAASCVDWDDLDYGSPVSSLKISVPINQGEKAQETLKLYASSVVKQFYSLLPQELHSVVDFKMYYYPSPVCIDKTYIKEVENDNNRKNL